MKVILTPEQAIAALTNRDPEPGTKASNPKDSIAGGKLPLHLWPETATLMGCLALLDGAMKYGRGNWRHSGVRASVYYDACRRHLNRWFEGEALDPESGVHHLGHALACLAILADAMAAGKLVDDRNTPGGYLQAAQDGTAMVPQIKANHAERVPPKHYTIEDKPQ